MDRLEVKNNIRIVRIDASEMKQKIKQSPKRCWEMIMGFIPTFQYEKLEILCEQLKKEHEKVARKPKSIDQFVVI